MKTYPSGKRFYNEQEKIQAKNVNLLDFLNTNYPGEVVYHKAKYRYCRNDDHSVEIFSDRRKQGLKEFQSFCRWSEGGVNGTGDNIDYLQEFHGMTFLQAVEALLDYGVFDDEDDNKRRAEVTEYRKKRIQERPAPPPEIDSTYDMRTKYYLHEFRGLDEKLIDDCFEKGLIYSVVPSPEEWCRAAFVNPSNGFWSIKGIAIAKMGRQAETTYQRVCAGNGYWVYTTGENVRTIYVTEAPIDALSLCELLNYKADAAFVAMCGLKPDAARRAFSDFPHAERKFICTDWDPKGIRFWRSNFELEGIKYMHPHPYAMEGTKDWNNILLIKNNGGRIS